MKKPKVRELGEAIRAVIRGPYTTRFPAEDHTPHPNFRGQPEFNAGHCVGCLACEQVCPVEAIAHEDALEGGDGPMRIMIHYTDTCIFCGQCEAVCIAEPKGIVLTNQWELSFFERREAWESIEKPLVCCERCGAVVACRDHLRWLAERLAERAYSSPTLYLVDLADLGLSDPHGAAPSASGSRADRFKVLCARCRRTTTLESQEEPHKSG